MRRIIAALAIILFATHANALGVSGLTNTEASSGLKDALIQGADKAVAKLGAVNGFYGDPQVKIPLPDSMKKAERVMHMFGMGKQADELVLKMNRAAEAAVPQAKALLVDSVKKMSLTDAKKSSPAPMMRPRSISRKPLPAQWPRSFCPSLKKLQKMSTLPSNTTSLLRWGLNMA